MDDTDSYVTYWPGGSGNTNSYLHYDIPPTDPAGVAGWSPLPVDKTAATVNPPNELPQAAPGDTCTATRNIYAVQEIEVYKKTGSVLSGIYDTQLTAPNYNNIGWTESIPTAAGTTSADIEVYAGSDSAPNMSSASWDSPDSANPHPLSIGSGRYAQLGAILYAVPYWECPSCGAEYTDTAYKLNPPASHLCSNAACSSYLIPAVKRPQLDNVTIDWPGEAQLCNVDAYFTQKPDYGIIKLTVDGQELMREVQIDITVSDDFRGDPVEISLTAGVEPRNTGR
jgi:hypothetical protein